VRASARLDANDPVGWERLATHQKFHVFLRKDIVRHHGDLIAAAHVFAQAIEKGSLAGAYWPADTDFQWFPHDQDRKRRL
jgi:hypothetical protein